jgi:hypothetical protein
MGNVDRSCLNLISEYVHHAAEILFGADVRKRLCKPLHVEFSVELMFAAGHHSLAATASTDGQSRLSEDLSSPALLLEKG